MWYVRSDYLQPTSNQKPLILGSSKLLLKHFLRRGLQSKLHTTTVDEKHDIQKVKIMLDSVPFYYVSRPRR